MKKLVASVGLVALGASTIQIQNALAVDQPAQPWNASLALRGFYDDNLSTVHKGTPGASDHTFGFEVSPSVGINWGNDQTTIFANYTYSFKKYDHTPVDTFKRYDQTHIFSLEVDHNFSELYSASVRDSFVIGQEPDVLQNGPLSTVQRISGSNVRNYGDVIFNGQFTPLFGAEIGYHNSYWDYAAEGNASPSALLDRIGHTVHLDGRWQATPDTVGVLGYQFRQVDYTDNEFIDTGATVPSKARDNRSHYGYVGADHTFSPDFTGSVRAGVQYIDFYNAPAGAFKTQFSPYALLSLRYTYAPQSYVEAGFTQSRVATDVGAGSVTAGGDFTHDIDASSLYAKVSHSFTPFLIGSLVGDFQYSKFNGGIFDGKHEQFYTLGLDAEYRFDRHLSAHAGYNFDDLNSQIHNRSFSRNRVYVGLTASY